MPSGRAPRAAQWRRAAVATVAAFSWFLLAGQPSAHAEGRFVTGEVVVGFEDGRASQVARASVGRQASNSWRTR